MVAYYKIAIPKIKVIISYILYQRERSGLVSVIILLLSPLVPCSYWGYGQDFHNIIIIIVLVNSDYSHNIVFPLARVQIPPVFALL
jgi:hypothetical protein